MLILAIDTSTMTGGVALLRDGALVGENILKVSAAHSERLMPAVESLLASSGCTPRDIDAVCCGVGPGSFTGVRIGVSASKGMAYALRIPIVGVPTLDALAVARSVGEPVKVWSLIDARHGRFYSACFRSAGEVNVQRLNDYAIRTVDDLAVTGDVDGRLLLVGDGAARYRDDIMAALGPRAWIPPEPLTLLRPVQVGLLGAAMLESGVRHDVASLAPFYLRPSEPELRMGAVGGANK